MAETPTYDWKYLICPTGRPRWDGFASEHAVWPTLPVSNGDFDCTRVAEDIAEHLTDGRDSATLCLEDMHGNRFEVDVDPETTVRYETTAYRNLGKVGGEPPPCESMYTNEDGTWVCGRLGPHTEHGGGHGPRWV